MSAVECHFGLAGGVGTTTACATRLGVLMAEHRWPIGVDLDRSHPALADRIGTPSLDIRDASDVALPGAALPLSERGTHPTIHAAPADPTHADTVTARHLAAVLAIACDGRHSVVIDAGCMFDALVVEALAVSDTVVLHGAVEAGLDGRLPAMVDLMRRIAPSARLELALCQRSVRTAEAGEAAWRHGCVPVGHEPRRRSWIRTSAVSWLARWRR